MLSFFIFIFWLRLRCNISGGLPAACGQRPGSLRGHVGIATFPAPPHPRLHAWHPQAPLPPPAGFSAAELCLSQEPRHQRSAEVSPRGRPSCAPLLADSAEGAADPAPGGWIRPHARWASAPPCPAWLSSSVGGRAPVPGQDEAKDARAGRFCRDGCLREGDFGVWRGQLPSLQGSSQLPAEISTCRPAGGKPLAPLSPVRPWGTFRPPARASPRSDLCLQSFCTRACIAF